MCFCRRRSGQEIRKFLHGAHSATSFGRLPYRRTACAGSALLWHSYSIDSEHSPTQPGCTNVTIKESPEPHSWGSRCALRERAKEFCQERCYFSPRLTNVPPLRSFLTTLPPFITNLTR